jgi:hypothetical protein
MLQLLWMGTEDGPSRSINTEPLDIEGVKSVKMLSSLGQLGINTDTYTFSTELKEPKSE